jgi:D-specific alpha-keto acid dehydrogenase
MTFGFATKQNTKSVGITVFGCEKDEAYVFRELSPRFGVTPTLTRAPVAECGAIPAAGNLCVSVGHKSRVSESHLIALREAGVRYISTRSAGCDHIDTKAAHKMGITVGNVAYSPDGVADYTLMLMLMAIRGAKSIVVNADSFDFRLNAIRGKELRDMTVGVVGTGRIGKAVIERLRGFGCRVLAHSRGCEAGRGFVPLCELLAQSDMITLHTPLNTNTYHMIGREQIEIMKRGAFLVNTGRGSLVDTGELITALEAGKLGGAALDVLEGEEGFFYFDCSQKPISHPFLLKLQRMPNVIITPHTAYYTSRALYDTVEKTLLNCLDFERRQAHG